MQGPQRLYSPHVTWSKINGNYPKQFYTKIPGIKTTRKKKTTDIALNNVPSCETVVSAISPSLLWNMTKKP